MIVPSQVAPADVAATGSDGRSCPPSHSVGNKDGGSEFPTVGSTLDKASFSALSERKRKQRVPGYCPVI